MCVEGSREFVSKNHMSYSAEVYNLYMYVCSMFTHLLTMPCM